MSIGKALQLSRVMKLWNVAWGTPRILLSSPDPGSSAWSSLNESLLPLGNAASEAYPVLGDCAKCNVWLFFKHVLFPLLLMNTVRYCLSFIWWDQSSPWCVGVGPSSLEAALLCCNKQGRIMVSITRRCCGVWTGGCSHKSGSSF